MRPKNIMMAAALVASVCLLLPPVADAQRGGRGGGGGGRGPGGGSGGQFQPRGTPGRPGGGQPGSGGQPQYRPAPNRPGPSRPNVYINTTWGMPYYDSLWWSYPRLWFPFGYAPFWYGPYWYDGYYGQFYDGDRGSLKLDVRPKKAEVFVDGRYTGIVDDFNGFLQSLDVASGNHTITLWLPGYKTVVQHVLVQDGSTLKLKYDMVQLGQGEQQDPRPLPPPGQMDDAVRSRGVRPFGPGRPFGPIRPGPPQPQLPPPDQPEAPPVPGQLQPIAEKPVPPASIQARDYGQLVIRVQPADAQILIDGEAWQTTGADRLTVYLPAGSHQVEVRKEGFRTFKAPVEIRNGEKTPLNVSLAGQDDK